MIPRADHLWHPWLRVARVMRGLLMNHASEETRRRIEADLRRCSLFALS
jgi:hypothetical protein